MLEFIVEHINLDLHSVFYVNFAQGLVWYIFQRYLILLLRIAKNIFWVIRHSEWRGLEKVHFLLRTNQPGDLPARFF